jgi:hypothetical protein
MTVEDCITLGEILRKYLQLDLVPGYDGPSRLVRQLEYLPHRNISTATADRGEFKLSRREVSSGRRIGLWGLSPSTVSRVIRGERPIDPDVAVQILLDLKPNEEDLLAFLRATHLDKVLGQASQLYRHAGFQSALTRATGLMWSGELGNLSRIRRTADIDSVPYVIAALTENSDARHSLTEIIERWQDAIEKSNIGESFRQHDTFHDLILQLAVLGFGLSHSIEETEAYKAQRERLEDAVHRVSVSRDDIQQSVSSLGFNPLQYTGYSVEDVDMVFYIHLHIANTLQSGEISASEEKILIHYDWLIPGSYNNP